MVCFQMRLCICFQTNIVYQSVEKLSQKVNRRLLKGLEHERQVSQQLRVGQAYIHAKQQRFYYSLGFLECYHLRTVYSFPVCLIAGQNQL